jgi:hypothetical protein
VKARDHGSIVSGRNRSFPQFGLSPSGVPERVRGVFHYVTAGAMVTLSYATSGKRRL